MPGRQTKFPVVKLAEFLNDHFSHLTFEELVLRRDTNKISDLLACKKPQENHAISPFSDKFQKVQVFNKIISQNSISRENILAHSYYPAHSIYSKLCELFNLAVTIKNRRKIYYFVRRNIDRVGLEGISDSSPNENTLIQEEILPTL